MRRSRPLAALASLMLVVVACGSSEPAGDVFSLAVGDCFDDPGSGEGQVSSVPLVDCAEPHDNEVFAVFDLPDGPFPGNAEVQEAADLGCVERFASFVGTDYAVSELFLSSLSPTQASWDGRDDREVICFLYEPGVRLVGSERGSGR